MMIETPLYGLFPGGFDAAGRINLSRLMRTGAAKSTAVAPPTQIHDARKIQAGSEHDFLEEHGFVLLNAPTAVRDWSDPAQALVYAREIEQLVRGRLYPGRRVEITQPPMVVRRGVGTDNPDYAGGVHQDHGVTAEDYQHNVAAFVSADIGERWRKRYEQDDAEGFVSLDFWRTTNMAGPLQHMPLALCDPSTVDPNDLVPTAFEGIAPNGAITHHVGLRANSAQRWYYYPQMQPDEVLVFKLFDCRKGEDAQRYRACLHSAVGDPSTPVDAERRQSCEHRVGVMLLSGDMIPRSDNETGESFHAE